MTSEQIIKAMICCTNFPVCDRDNCPYGESTNCATMLGKDVVELINRQKAEIERLKKLLAESEANENKAAKRFYKEGVKDFAKRLKNITSSIVLSGGKHKYDVVTTQGIDYVLKDLAGEK